jgi:hypothetical protein
VNITGTVPGQPTVPVAPIPMHGPIKDPTAITSLRQRLVSVLPRVPELERLKIWPWWPWTPWLDCSPDIIFKVTQDCGDGQDRVIVNENIFQARWDVPTNLNVTLVANDKACCLNDDPPDPLGDCAAITAVCTFPVDEIGGNPGAAANPVGYANPGGRDRPFSEQIHLRGLVGVSPQTAFYEIEFSPHGAGTWNPVPGITLGGFHRRYFDGSIPGPPFNHPASFPVISVAGKNFYKSRHHYQATNPPPIWGGLRIWLGDNYDLLAPVFTANNFVDGNYDFRIVGYRASAGDPEVPDIASRQVLNGCGIQPNQNNLVVVRLDNRVSGGLVPGTVHVDTTEPACRITAVRLGATPVAACGSQQLQPSTPLEIDFRVTDNPIGADANGHLDHYELWIKWDIGSRKNLLDSADVGTFSLLPVSAQFGPDYANAITQPGGGRPTWTGGNFTLRINDASRVFPRTCCYLIQLLAYKRNIVSCSTHLVYYNETHYTFTILV